MVFELPAPSFDLERANKLLSKLEREYRLKASDLQKDIDHYHRLDPEKRTSFATPTVLADRRDIFSEFADRIWEIRRSLLGRGTARAT